MPDTETRNAGIEISHVRNFGVSVGENTVFSGMPKITYTLAVDQEKAAATSGFDRLNIDDFKGVISLGKNVYLDSSDAPAFHNQPVKLTSVRLNNHNSGRIIIKDNVYLPGTAIIAYEQVTIEENVILGPMVTIMDSSGHAIRARNTAHEAEKITVKPVTIKQNAWIGTAAIILKGVTIGENSVVGAGSVVYESIPDNVIAIGNPAKVVKKL
ncbi:acyltransferase [Cysteiniphilum sp. 19S12-1]